MGGESICFDLSFDSFKNCLFLFPEKKKETRSSDKDDKQSSGFNQQIPGHVDSGKNGKPGGKTENWYTIDALGAIFTT